jgi:hypothetical protein
MAVLYCRRTGSVLESFMAYIHMYIKYFLVSYKRNDTYLLSGRVCNCTHTQDLFKRTFLQSHNYDAAARHIVIGSY